MKILIVDDNDNKRTAVEEVLKKMDIHHLEVDCVKSVTSCIIYLCKEEVDILILDEQLPITDNSAINENGGIEIINTIKTDRSIIKPQKVIYLSAYTESLQQISNVMTHSAILYQEDSVEWAEKLMEIVSFYEMALAQRKRQFLYDVALIATTEPEYCVLKQLSANWATLKIPGDSAIYEETEWMRNGKIYKVVATKLNQMGMPAAATATSKMIYEFVPRYVAMYGIAGGVENDAKFGDIIVATKVWDYCSGKYDSPEDVKGKDCKDKMLSGAIKAFKPTSNSINAEAKVINMQSKDYNQFLYEIYKSYIPSKMQEPPKVWWGSLACGSSVVKNPAIVDEMVRKYDRKTLGIDMESYGIFYAVENSIAPVPTAICVKAISDFADKDKTDEYQQYAAEMSGKFIKELLMDLLDNV